MRKLFLFFLLSLVSWNLPFAQVAKTFVPDEGKTYYFKNQDKGSGRDTSYLGQSTGDISDPDGSGDMLEDMNIIQNIVRDTEGALGDDAMGWKISYVTDKGYTIQNKESGLYWKYIGSYDGVEKTNGQNYIYLDQWNADESERFYFEFRESNAKGSIGNSEYTFKIQGYLIVCVGSMDDQALDAYSKVNTGTWKFENTSKPNQIWWPMTGEDLADFDKGMAASKFPFLPDAGKDYYIKTMREDRGLYHRYIAQSATADTILNLDITDQAVRSNDYAKWNFELDKDAGLYLIKNKATGKYLMFTAEAGDKNKTSGLIGTGDKATVDDIARLAISLEAPRSRFVLGLEGFEGIPSFSIQPYYIGFNYSPGQGLSAIDNYKDGVDRNRVSTWDNGHNDVYVNWLIMADSDIDNMVEVRKDAVFTLEEGAEYTIRPNNLTKKYPLAEDEATAEELAEFEREKNSRLADGDDGWSYFDFYDLDDDAIKWNIIPTSGGNYRISNVMSNNFLTIGKWTASEGVSGKQLALDAVTMSSYDASNKNQELSIAYKGYVIDEYGKPTKVFAILNNNVLPEPVDANGNVVGKNAFYLDVLDGESLASQSPGSWGGDGSGTNQQYLIRTIAKDQPSSVEYNTGAATAKVFVTGNIVKVVTDTDATISVYTISGNLLKQTTETEFAIPASGLYIIKVGVEAFKVIIK